MTPLISPLVAFYGAGLLVVVAVIVLAMILGRRANRREGYTSARERTLEARHRRERMDAEDVDAGIHASAKHGGFAP